MPTWKKVVVSGSGVSQLTNDTNYLIDGQSAAALTGSFTGSFIGDGSGLTGLATNLAISGSTGNDTVDLLNDSLSVVGAGGISTTVTDNVITINSNGLVSGSVQVDITGTTGYSTFSSSLAGDIASNASAIAALDGAYATDAELSTVSGALATSIDSTASTAASNLSSTSASLASSINSEASTRLANDNTLQTNIDSEASTRTSAITAVQNDVDANETTAANNLSAASASLAVSITSVEGDLSSTSASLASSITSTASTAASNLSSASSSLAAGIATNAAAIAGLDSTYASNVQLSDASASLASSITVEQGRINAILSASSADADTFAEIVTLINSVDTTNDQAFASYYTSSNNRLTDLETDSGSFSTRVSANEAAIAGLDSTYATDAQLSSVSGALATSIDSTASTAASNLSSTSASLASSITANASAIAGLDSTYATDAQLTAVSGAFETTVSSVSGALASSITVEQGRINAILSASSADKDSFAEIVTLINSVDLENDQAFAAYYTSSNNRLTDLETDSGSFSTRVSANEATIANLDGTYATDAQLSSISGALAASAVSFSSSLAADIANLDSTYATDAQLSSDSASLASSITSNASTAANNLSAASGALALSITNVEGDLSSTSASLAASIVTNASAIANLDSTYATDAQLSSDSASLASSITSNASTAANNLSAASGALASSIGNVAGDLSSTSASLASSITSTASTAATNLSSTSASLAVSITANAAAIAGLDSTYATDAELSAVSGALASGLVVEKGRIDAILSASTADADTFAEIVTLINSVDTTNDQAFASYYTSSNNRLTDLETDSGSFSTRVSANETAIAGLDGTYATDAQLSAVSGAFETTIAGLTNDYNELLNVPAGIVSSSAQQVANLVGEDVVANSFTGNGSGLTNLTVAQTATIVETFSAVTSHTVTHNFGSDNILATVYDSSGFQIIPASVQATGANTVVVTFAEATSGKVIVGQGGHIVSGSIAFSSILAKPTLVSGSGQIQIDNVDGFTAFSSSVESRIDALDGTYATDAELSSVSGALASSIGNVAGDLSSTSASLASSIVGVAGDLSSTSASLAASIAGLDSTYATDAELSAVSGAFETTIAGLTNDYNELLNVPAGIVSGSTLTSPSQGTAVLTNNGVAQTADLGLQVGDSPTFASLTLTGNLTVTGDTISANVANLDVEDRFILLNSGSNSGDAGIIFGGSDGTANAGSGIFWDSPANVFGFAQAIGSADTSATHQSKLGNIEVSAGAPSGAPLFQGVGTIHVDSSTGDVLIYV